MKYLNDITAKAFLYAAPLFLTPFIDKLGNTLFGGDWPTLPALAGCTLLGTVSMCIGVRAYYDGSYQRRKSGDDADDLPLSPLDTPTPNSTAPVTGGPCVEREAGTISKTTS